MSSCKKTAKEFEKTRMNAAVAKFESIFVLYKLWTIMKIQSTANRAMHLPNRDTSVFSWADLLVALNEQVQEHTSRHKWVCTLHGMMAWNGFTKFRIGPSGRLLKTQQQAIRLSKGRDKLKLKSQ